LKQYADDCIDELEYYTSVEQHLRSLNADNEARSSKILEMILELATKNKQQPLVDAIKTKKNLLNLQ